MRYIYENLFSGASFIVEGDEGAERMNTLACWKLVKKMKQGDKSR